MSDKFKDLASRAIKYEQKMNAYIQEKADNDQLINLTNKGIQKHTKTLRWLRQMKEWMLNPPAKNEVEGVDGVAKEREENVLSMLKSMMVEEISTAFKTSLRNALEDTLVRGRGRD